MTNRSFETVLVGASAFEFEVMVYGETGARQPLLILHSIEFAMPPSEVFCEIMWHAGYQVIFARRPGHGRTSPIPDILMTEDPMKSGATVMAEAAVISSLVKTLGLEQIVLLAVGSSNPVSYRLVHTLPSLAFTIFANPVFNQDIFEVFRPVWFQQTVKQMLVSKGGAKFASQGAKLLLKSDPIAYYKAIMQKNAGDLAYIEANKTDIVQAAALALETNAEMLYYDATSCLAHDAILKDRYFDGVNAVILIGQDTTEHWQTEMRKESERLNLPLVLAPDGDLFCAYASPTTVLEIIRESDQDQKKQAG